MPSKTDKQDTQTEEAQAEAQAPLTDAKTGEEVLPQDALHPQTQAAMKGRPSPDKTRYGETFPYLEDRPLSPADKAYLKETLTDDMYKQYKRIIDARVEDHEALSDPKVAAQIQARFSKTKSASADQSSKSDEGSSK